MATADKNSSEATIKDLQEQLAELKSDFVGVADILKKIAAGEINAASDTVKTRAEAAAEKARSAASDAKAQMTEATASARQTIADHPFTAAAIAAAAGFVVGILARR